MRAALVVTGVAPHSLGEAFVQQYRARMPATPVIGLDRADNRGLSGLPEYCSFGVDLDGLRSGARTGALHGQCREALSRFLGRDGFVECLVQSAGVYDYGALHDMDEARISRVFGTNLVGHLDVLRAVLDVNAERGVDSGALLSYIDVGSTYGLTVGAGRSIYASSKAAVLAVAAALALGREVHRSIYLAPGPIDTGMLHRNHWVTKAGGDRTFYETVAAGPADIYEGVFARCEPDALHDLTDSRSNVAEAFAQYRDVRQQALRGELGVLAPAECGGMLVAIAAHPERFASGIYVATAPPGRKAMLRYAPFAWLSGSDVMQKAMPVAFT